jgi:hypothetical protein
VVKRERDAAIRELRCKEEATRRELEVVKCERDAAIRHKEEALRELRSREEATRRAEAAVRARDEAIRSKDAEIARLRRLAYGVEVLDVDAGVTRVVEEAGAGAEPPLKRMRLEQAAGARVVGALQERLVAVKKEEVEGRATRHSGRGGGGGEGGGYGGYNYGAPSYNPPPVAWPGQPSFMNGHSGFGGGPFMQAPNGYGAPQMGGYLGMQGLMNIPAGAMYNGRPINSSNANSVFGSNTAARQSQQSASHPAPPQKSSTNGYPQSYNQGNTPTYAQQPYVVPQPRGTLFEVHAWCSSSLRVPL